MKITQMMPKRVLAKSQKAIQEALRPITAKELESSGVTLESSETVSKKTTNEAFLTEEPVGQEMKMHHTPVLGNHHPDRLAHLEKHRPDLYNRMVNWD
jgi:hypothetical protein